MKDTTDILGKLYVIKSFPKNTYLIFLGFKSLCTSIPNLEMIKPAKDSFGIHISKNMVTKVMTPL